MPVAIPLEEDRTVATAATPSPTLSRIESGVSNMGTLAFRFQDEHLNDQLAELLEQRRIQFTRDKKGNIIYDSDFEEIVENEVINSIRDQIFPFWKLLSAPDDWLERYQTYMQINKIPYLVEYADDEMNFLIPGNFNPHRWRAI
jgi:hypothetical protein